MQNRFERLAVLVIPLAVSACGDINWQRTAQDSVESACRGAGNCAITCDARSPATANQPRCNDPGRRR